MIGILVEIKSYILTHISLNISIKTQIVKPFVQKKKKIVKPKNSKI